ncbi:hypothetical protein DESUT3_01950 [Desulfuromonas versatilis]|uniref:Methyl-accepting chemotaxis protein n=1 Tax=Desulfuromonas versatilis TaxID=2802975 RepID=A0ABN6DSX9_9BACT|nr:methyl-accepting chemotaxis protein [Desulfuromonas versatilis]BCR03126.1 hypothetical protein DESUT3_01950 [Desulfuromonas versatilis]
MKWFVDLPTRFKLLLGFGLMVLFLLGLTLSAQRTIVQMDKAKHALVEGELRFAMNLAEMRAHLNHNWIRILQMLQTSDRAQLRQFWQDVEGNAEEFDGHWQQSLGFIQGHQELRERSDNIGAILAEYRQSRQQIRDLLSDGQTSEAQRIAWEFQEARYLKIEQMLSEMGVVANDMAKLALARSKQHVRGATRVFLAMGILAGLTGLVLVFSLTRIIARPLKSVVELAERVAAGELTEAANPTPRRDEVGDLEKAFARMLRSLRQMAETAERISSGDLTMTVSPQSDKDSLGHAFASMVQGLRKITGEIHEGINVLASSASEIMAAASQVSAGAAETSAAVTQTTTTVQEVKQTAQLSSQKAKLVSGESQASAQLLEEGKQWMDEAVEGIHQAQEKMAYVSEAILSLSEQSQAIGEIIATVNDLAEQSNLLAVNASIEAAKAGEQGKGFAVVAQEVKYLAEQSKQATNQVRSILKDIQKATGTAVLATEQGAKSVEAGVRQTRQAGEAMQKAVISSGRVTQAALQIAKSSDEQLVGMDQVALAMGNIKEASLQNVSSTKQTETVVKGLHELGQKMKGLVEQFRV